MLNQDYREMLSILSDNDVRFLVVGAYAWDKRKNVEIEGLKIPIIGINELIKSKLSAGRDKDIADIKKLKNKS